ncbi:MAG: serine carboxypeptidase [Ruminococcus sp.]|nr:serine carboxypeptidase [Ruminococcus sp.]
MKRSVLCVGGDARMIYMCEKLARDADVYSYLIGSPPRGVKAVGSLEDVMGRADVLVLPMLRGVRHSGGKHYLQCGLTSLELSELLPVLRDGAVVTGGLPDAETAVFFERNGFELIDYFKRRELVIRNCIPTAEGALMIAMQEQAFTVFGSRVLITGFGNVAAAAARLFKAAGAKVCCAVRRCDAAAEAESAGYESVMFDRLGERISEADTVINTVPALVLTAPLLKKLEPKALVIDLASVPGGVDKEAAEALGVRCVHALALPGRVAPVTAGRYIAEAVEHIISERGEQNVIGR